MIKERKEIKVELIDVDNIAIRPAKVDTAEFQGLMADIANRGISQNLEVRPSKVSGRYTLVDGLQRFTAAQRLKLETVPCVIVDVDDITAMTRQMGNNLHRIATKPAEFGKQLQRMLGLNATLTVQDLAKMVGSSPQFITDRLSLNSLDEDIAKKVDDGQISAQNAIKLAKLPVDKQKELLADAVNKTAKDFVPQVEAELKAIREAKSKGDKAGDPVFEPVARLRTRNDIVEEHSKHTFRAVFVNKNTKPLEAWDLAIAWVLQLDEESINFARKQFEANLKAKKERAEKVAAERERKRQENAAKKNDDLNAAISE